MDVITSRLSVLPVHFLSEIKESAKSIEHQGQVARKIMAETREACFEHTKQVLEVVEKMGLKVNGVKAQPVTQRRNSYVPS